MAGIAQGMRTDFSSLPSVGTQNTIYQRNPLVCREFLFLGRYISLSGGFLEPYSSRAECLLAEKAFVEENYLPHSYVRAALF